MFVVFVADLNWFDKHRLRSLVWNKLKLEIELKSLEKHEKKWWSYKWKLDAGFLRHLS